MEDPLSGGVPAARGGQAGGGAAEHIRNGVDTHHQEVALGQDRAALGIRARNQRRRLQRHHMGRGGGKPRQRLSSGCVSYCYWSGKGLCVSNQGWRWSLCACFTVAPTHVSANKHLLVWFGSVLDTML